MTYKLAKQLKKAGFKQDGKGSWVHQRSVRITPSQPNLSELIEACGDGFEGLQRMDGELKIGKEELKAPYFICSKYDENIDDEIMATYGKTPEEAVAKLWLKLQ